jgi:hypothetical protein
LNPFIASGYARLVLPQWSVTMCTPDWIARG